MPPRRTHTKSRGGCSECRRRKVKCNEDKPICAGCIKHETACEYPLLGSSKHGGDALRPLLRNNKSLPLLVASTAEDTFNALPHGTRASGLADPLIPTKSLGHYRTEDIALWHQFITSTAGTMSSPWERDIPTLALSCDYLIHGMMSTAAHHLAYLHPDQREKYELLATQHQDIALGTFRTAIQNINPENCNQVFAFSLLLIMCHFASFRSPELLLPSPETTLDTGVANWIAWHRGCQTILNQARSYIKAGPLGPLLGEETRARARMAALQRLPGNADPDDESIDRLLTYFDTSVSFKTSTTVAEMETYKDATNQLRRLLAGSMEAAEDALTLRAFTCVWPVIISDHFIQLLSELRPPALAIMAHYCLLIKRCEPCWYMDRRAHALFEAVRQHLSNGWTICIRHPLSVFRAAPDPTSDSQ